FSLSQEPSETEIFQSQYCIQRCQSPPTLTCRRAKSRRTLSDLFGFGTFGSLTMMCGAPNSSVSMLPTPPLTFQAKWPRNGLNRQMGCGVGGVTGTLFGPIRDPGRIIGNAGPGVGAGRLCENQITAALHSGDETRLFRL